MKMIMPTHISLFITLHDKWVTWMQKGNFTFWHVMENYQVMLHRRITFYLFIFPN